MQNPPPLPGSLDDRLHALDTPALLLDEARMRANVLRLRQRAEALGVTLRPHLKTVKSVDAARQVLGGATGATVSTLREAEVFFAAGVQDIVYAVGIAPHKLERVVALLQAGCALSVLLDTPAQADAVLAASRKAGVPIPALIEIDCDGHRGGVKPDNPQLQHIGRLLHSGGLLRGVLTHAGESYAAVGIQAQADCAERERFAAVDAAHRLRAAGLPCPVVSVGSTPTAHAAQHLDGVTELRAGVYVFFDLVMAGIGACRVDDIALSVLTTVIGHQCDRGWILVDAGWMALSGDRGTARQTQDQGYGQVCDAAGQILPDLLLTAVNQEHGIISLRPGSAKRLPELALGTRLRILPNHACATAAQFDAYQVLPAEPGAPWQRWPRFRGW